MHQYLQASREICILYCPSEINMSLMQCRIHVGVHAAPAAEPAMETAASLVDQFLPELMAAQEDKCGENLDMTELMRQIDALAADLGMQRAEP